MTELANYTRVVDLASDPYNPTDENPEGVRNSTIYTCALTGVERKLPEIICLEDIDNCNGELIV